MGIIGFGQRRRTNRLLADQLSVMRTGRTQAELRDQARARPLLRRRRASCTRRSRGGAPIPASPPTMYACPPTNGKPGATPIPE